jgi:hypothetical protein
MIASVFSIGGRIWGFGKSIHVYVVGGNGPVPFGFGGFSEKIKNIS